MNKQDLAYAISTTLGDHIEDFDIDAIVEEIGATYGFDIAGIDDIPADEYAALIERHDITAKHETANTEDSMPLTLVSANAGDTVPGIEISDPDSPITWESLPAAAQQWATEQGYGDDDSELLYVLKSDDEVPGGFPSYQLS